MRLRFDRQLRNGENVQWQLGLRPIGPTTAKIAIAKARHRTHSYRVESVARCMSEQMSCSVPVFGRAIWSGGKNGIAGGWRWTGADGNDTPEDRPGMSSSGSVLSYG